MGKPLGSLDVSGLARLVSTGQQNDHGSAMSHEVHAVSRSTVDPKLEDAVSDRPAIPNVSKG
jgi:hypothetical protein